MQTVTGKRASPQEIAEGFLTIAVANMARAIKQISIERGHDVAFYTLNCFGGAAGQHACLVADALGISCVMIHPLAGVLSAYGIGIADMTTVRERTINQPLETALTALGETIDALAAEARNALLAQGVPLERIETTAMAEIRYEGVDGGGARLARIARFPGQFDSGTGNASPPRVGQYRSEPDHARSVQQPLHGRRRRDGPCAAEHRLFREHQGAPRFFLRAVRSRW